MGVAANGLGVFDLIQEERFKRCGAQERILVGELALVIDWIWWQGRAESAPLPLVVRARCREWGGRATRAEAATGRASSSRGELRLERSMSASAGAPSWGEEF